MADSISRCGHWKVRFRCRGCSTVWEGFWRCGVRLCPRCARRRAWGLFGEYGDLVDQPRLKHLVLTIPNVEHLTRGVINELRGYFRRLRRRDPFRRGWRGGLYSVEMTFHKATRWHVHLHVLIEGAYIPHAEIRRVWEEICGGQRVVSIQAATNPREVLKYILKPGADLLGDPGAIMEFLEATRSNRLTHPWGVWYRQVKRENPGKRVCPECGSSDVEFEIIRRVVGSNLGVRGPPGPDVGGAKV